MHTGSRAYLRLDLSQPPGGQGFTRGFAPQEMAVCSIILGISLDAIVHMLHVILAGAWLGGIVFTTTVVSPALKSMGWDEVERARVRSVIGRQYAKVGTANLVLLMVLALLEGALSGFGPILYSEYALLAVLFGLVASHGAYFGRRLVELAEARKEAGASEKAQVLALRRRRLQRLSFWISMLTILVSAAVLILATYARAG